MTLEEFLTMMTTIFEAYQKMTKGAVLTKKTIEARQGHHNVAIGDATAIVNYHGRRTNVLSEDAVFAI